MILTANLQPLRTIFFPPLVHLIIKDFFVKLFFNRFNFISIIVSDTLRFDFLKNLNSVLYYLAPSLLDVSY